MKRQSLLAGLLAACVLAAMVQTSPAASPAAYTAQGTLEVQPIWNVPSPSGGEAPALIPPEYYKAHVASVVAGVKNPRVLTAALEKLKVDGTPSYYEGPDSVQRLAKDLKVEHAPDTFLVTVALTGPDAKQVQALVREVLNHYISQARDDHMQAEQDRQKGLREEQADLRKQVDRLAADLARYRDETSVVITDDRSSEQLARLVTLTRQLSETQLALAEASNEWNRFQEIRKEVEKGKDATAAMMAFPEILERMNSDPGIKALEQEVGRRSMELATAPKAGKPGDEEVLKAAKAALEYVKNELDSLKATRLGELFQMQAASLKTRYDRLRTAEAELLNRVAEARTAAISAAKQAADYRSREDEYRRVRTLLDIVSDGLERMRIESALATSTIRIVEFPMIPLQPDTAKPASKP